MLDPRARTRISSTEYKQIQRPTPSFHRHDPKSTQPPPKPPPYCSSPRYGGGRPAGDLTGGGGGRAGSARRPSSKARQGLAERSGPAGTARVEARPGPPGTPFGDARTMRARRGLKSPARSGRVASLPPVGGRNRERVKTPRLEGSSENGPREAPDFVETVLKTANHPGEARALRTLPTSSAGFRVRSHRLAPT